MIVPRGSGCSTGLGLQLTLFGAVALFGRGWYGLSEAGLLGGRLWQSAGSRHGGWDNAREVVDVPVATGGGCLLLDRAGALAFWVANFLLVSIECLVPL